MSNLQSFSQAPQLVNTPAPTNTGSGAGDGLRGLSSALNVVGGVRKSALANQQAAAKSQGTASVAQGYIESENYRRLEPLSELVSDGFISQAQMNDFGKNIQSDLKVLDQVRKQGGSKSVRNALDRSVKFQNEAVKNPSNVQDLAAAYKINDAGIGEDTLASLEKHEREQLKASAIEVRKLAAEYGYSDLLTITDDQDAIDAWLLSPAVASNYRIKQNTKKIEDKSTSLEVRSFAASENASINLSQFPQLMNKIQSEHFLENGSLGGTTTTMGYAEKVRLAADDMIAQVMSENREFPSIQKTSIESINLMVENRIRSQKDSASQGYEEFRQGLRPLERAAKEQQVIQSVFNNSQNATKSLANSLRVASMIDEKNLGYAKAVDQLKTDQSSGLMETDARSKYLTDPSTIEYLGIMETQASESANLILMDILQPDEAKARRSADAATYVIAELAHQGVDGNNAAFNNAMNALGTAYDMNVNSSPSAARRLEGQAKNLFSDPTFVAIAKSSPSARRLLKPLKESVKAQVVQSVASFMDDAVEERIASGGAVKLGSSEQQLLWNKLGKNMIVDSAATNSAGVPQMKLVNGIDNQYPTEEIVKFQSEIDRYNQRLIRTENPNLYSGLTTILGHRSLSKALDETITSSMGVSLESLSSTRTLDPIDPKDAARAKEVMDFRAGENLGGVTPAERIGL